MNSKLLGSILIIAGSSIGAGMLAMPITSAGVGFLGTTLLLFIIWFAMCYTALLMVRIYDYNLPTDGFDTLTKKYANKSINRLAGLSLMFLIYGLTAAYMTGGGTIVKSNVDLLFDTNIDNRLAILAFSIVFSGIVIISTRSVDMITRGLFAAKLVFLLLLVLLMAPLIKGENLLHMPLSQGIILTSLPAIFTSFGFHGSIPTIVNYLDGNKKLLKKAFILGSLLPLVVYLIWQIVVLGSLDQTSFMIIMKKNLGLEGLILSIREMSHSANVETLFSLFAATGLGTSFLGVSIGLFDYYKDLFKNKSKAIITPLSGATTFIPPLLFALFYPTGFIVALGYAAIAGVILALIIPSVLYIKAMKYHKQPISALQYAILGFIFFLSILVVIAQLIIVSA
ncbi:aromatic amino acid transport family protein [Myroides injenensis]|uniref:aromatic amino acid transport family protein n=1 Tax=Myroides injenensis TaxID=1183151 RepID=UPI0002884819|nr:aromatic amino acid transport family protein [Myroides injenensis]